MSLSLFFCLSLTFSFTGTDFFKYINARIVFRVPILVTQKHPKMTDFLNTFLVCAVLCLLLIFVFYRLTIELKVKKWRQIQKCAHFSGQDCTLYTVVHELDARAFGKKSMEKIFFLSKKQ